MTRVTARKPAGCCRPEQQAWHGMKRVKERTLLPRPAILCCTAATQNAYYGRAGAVAGKRRGSSWKARRGGQRQLKRRRAAPTGTAPLHGPDPADQAGQAA
jgi:hypothetical protein